MHAGDLLCRINIQPGDLCLAVFAGQDAAVKRAFLIHVRGVFGKPGRFIETVEPSGLFSD